MVERTIPIRILLVDDAAPVREAMRWAFEDEADLTVIGEAGDGKQALALAESLAPDVVILDIELPEFDGYAVASALKAAPMPPVIVFLSVHSDAASRRRAAAAGGDSFVEKGRGWPALITQIRILFADV
jgi:DNA-binding NarL/FixJ family response regulator